MNVEDVNLYSYSGVAEVSVLLESGAMSLGEWFPTFRRIILASFSGWSNLGLLTLKALRSFRTDRNYSPKIER